MKGVVPLTTSSPVTTHPSLRLCFDRVEVLQQVNNSAAIWQGLSPCSASRKLSRIIRLDSPLIICIAQQMGLLEVEQKFRWNPANLQRLICNNGRPPFPSTPIIHSKSFRDTYYDSGNLLSDNGLWIRKRQAYISRGQRDMERPSLWEAKQSIRGSSFAKSAYEETQDVGRIMQMIGRHIPECLGPDKAFGLRESCGFVTHRRFFNAEDRFYVVLDETDFGHSAGEVELLAEDADEAHLAIDDFMARYAWFFDKTNPKGKLTAFFEHQALRGQS